MAATHSHPVTGARLRLALVLTALVLVVELAGGLLSHSLALLSDAGHVLTDIVALALAWFATSRAEKPADARNTFGYHRTGILAALANAITLIVIVGGIAVAAVQRLGQPQPVTPWIMIAAAAVGVAVNLAISLGLRDASHHNLNVRGARLHALGDVGASVGVILGAVIIALTGWRAADPLISLAIALLIAKGAWDLLVETVDILMEATPRDLNVADLVRDMARVSGVGAVHDLHIWSLAGGMRLLSAHVQLSEDRSLAECDQMLDQIHRLLCERYAIQHTTLQIETAGCDQSDLYCALPHGEHDHTAPDHDHAHRRAAQPAQR